VALQLTPRCALIFEGRDLDHPLPPEAWVMLLPIEIDIFYAGKK
jgi:hypothetical protein